jgi:putative transposase
MCTVGDSGPEVKGEARGHWRARVRSQAEQEEEENQVIFGEGKGGKRKARRERREEMREKVKEYQRQFPRRNGEFRQELEESVLKRVARKFEAGFAARVMAVVGRADGVQRDERDRTVVPEFCSVCETHRRAKFYRDGYWKRFLHTRWGRVELRVPRVRCECGGAVVIAYEQFAPYQRQFEDIQGQILGLSALCLSLRQIRAVLVMNGTRLSIATVCKEIGKVADLSAAEFKRKCGVPPVVLLDAIWGNLAQETGEKFTNARGQEREHKEVEKVPLLVAWGIWPETGEKALLGWVVGKQENQAAWQKLLEALHARGLHADKGLRLFVSDGSSGLEAALGMVSFGRVLHQRCVFHKIRNVVDKVKGEAIEGDQKAKREARRKRREEVLADLAPIWQAASEGEARRRYAAFVAKWEAKEPQAVAGLRNGFEATLVFYGVQAQAAAEGKQLEARYLRTTSPLERANRNIRVKLRAATIFQTEGGLMANVYLALGVRGKKEPEEIHEWIEAIVGRVEELQRAA